MGKMFEQPGEHFLMHKWADFDLFQHLKLNCMQMIHLLSPGLISANVLNLTGYKAFFIDVNLASVFDFCFRIQLTKKLDDA